MIPPIVSGHWRDAPGRPSSKSTGATRLYVSQPQAAAAIIENAATGVMSATKSIASRQEESGFAMLGAFRVAAHAVTPASRPDGC